MEVQKLRQSVQRCKIGWERQKKEKEEGREAVGRERGRKEERNIQGAK